MLTVFYDAPLAVQIHAISALIALLLGPFVIFRKKRDWLHKRLGYIWVTEMVSAAVSSFWITSPFGLIGPFSPIHALSVWALWTVWTAVGHARAGRIGQHSAELKGLYFYGVGIASTLTLLPGRRLNAILFGENEVLGLWAMGAIAGLAALVILHNRTGVFSLVKRGELR